MSTRRTSRNALRITNAAAPLVSAAGTPSPTLYSVRKNGSTGSDAAATSSAALRTVSAKQSTVALGWLQFASVLSRKPQAIYQQRLTEMSRTLDNGRPK